MTGFAVLLGAAAIGFGLARWVGVPSTPFLIFGGFLLSLAGLLPEAEILENVLLLGLSFLLFAAGAELDVHRVGQYRWVALQVGIAQFFVLAVAGTAAALALGFALTTSLYLALAVAASSTLVVVRLLQQRGQMFEPFGRMVTGVLLLQDLFVITLAPVLIRLPDGAGSVAVGFGLTVAMIALAYVLQRWVLPHLVLRWELSGESLLLLTLSLLFGFVGLTYAFDLPIITGAFLAGVSLSSFPVSGLVREQLTPITDFFLAIFFTVLGAFIIIPDATALLAGLVFALLVLVGTPPLVTFFAERAGFSVRAALESGLLLAQTSELSLVVGLLALTAEELAPEVFSVIVLVTVLTMIATPFLTTGPVTLRLLRWYPYHVSGPASAPRNHIVLLGCGDTGMPLLETLFLAGYDVVVIDDDPSVVRYLRENDVPAIRGDASDPEALRKAGAEDARAVVSMVRRPRDTEVVLKQAPETPVLVRVFTDEDADWVEEHGGTPVRYSAAAADAFARWFEEEFAAADAS